MNSRQLSVKERDLQQWEDTLTRRQNLFDQGANAAEHRLKGYEAKVEARGEELAHLDRELETKKKKVEEEMARLDAAASKAEERKTLGQQQLASLGEKLETTKRQIKEAHALHEEILKEIDTREAYQKEQERAIADASDKGNERLQEINSEIKKFEVEREQLLLKITAETSQIAHLQGRVDTVEADLVRITDRYKDVAAEYRQELINIKLEIAEAQTTRDRTIAETDSKLLELKAERAELEASRNVLVKQQEDIWAEKHRLDSLKAQYGI